MREVIIKKVKDSYFILQDIFKTFNKYSNFNVIDGIVKQLLWTIRKTDNSYMVPFPDVDQSSAIPRDTLIDMLWIMKNSIILLDKSIDNYDNIKLPRDIHNGIIYLIKTSLFDGSYLFQCDRESYDEEKISEVFDSNVSKHTIYKNKKNVFHLLKYIGDFEEQHAKLISLNMNEKTIPTLIVCIVKNDSFALIHKIFYDPESIIEFNDDEFLFNGTVIYKFIEKFSTEFIQNSEKGMRLLISSETFESAVNSFAKAKQKFNFDKYNVCLLIGGSVNIFNDKKNPDSLWNDTYVDPSLLESAESSKDGKPNTKKKPNRRSKKRTKKQSNTQNEQQDEQQDEQDIDQERTKDEIRELEEQNNILEIVAKKEAAENWKSLESKSHETQTNPSNEYPNKESELSSILDLIRNTNLPGYNNNLKLIFQAFENIPFKYLVEFLNKKIPTNDTDILTKYKTEKDLDATLPYSES